MEIPDQEDLQMPTFFSRLWRHGLIAVIILTVASGLGMASILGDTVEIQYRFPNVTTLFGLSATGVVTAGGVTLNLFDNQHVIVLPDSVQMVGVRDPSTFFQPGSFNGVSVQDLTHPSVFTGFSIDPATTIAAFNLSDVSISGGLLFINYQNLTTPLHSLAQVDFTTGATIPEPATIGLTLLALGLLVYLRQARRART
jgi:hypothetical protein